MNDHAFNRGLQVARSMAHRGHVPSAKERAMLERAAKTCDIKIHKHPRLGVYMATKDNPNSVLALVWTDAFKQRNQAIAQALLQHEYKVAMAAMRDLSVDLMEIPQRGYRTKHAAASYKID